MSKKITKVETMIKVGCTNPAQFNRFLAKMEYDFSLIPISKMKKDFILYKKEMIKNRYINGKQGRPRKNT